VAEDLAQATADPTLLLQAGFDVFIANACERRHFSEQGCGDPKWG
jgi:hypothetical protein